MQEVIENKKVVNILVHSSKYWLFKTIMSNGVKMHSQIHDEQ